MCGKAEHMVDATHRKEDREHRKEMTCTNDPFLSFQNPRIQRGAMCIQDGRILMVNWGSFLLCKREMSFLGVNLHNISLVYVLFRDSLLNNPHQIE